MLRKKDNDNGVYRLLAERRFQGVRVLGRVEIGGWLVVNNMCEPIYRLSGVKTIWVC